MSDEPASYRDPIGFVMEQLGKTKTAAEQTGDRQIENFEHIEHLLEEADREHGIKIAASQITFENPITQAAWVAKQGRPEGPPLMDHEDDITLRAVV